VQLLGSDVHGGRLDIRVVGGDEQLEEAVFLEGVARLVAPVAVKGETDLVVEPCAEVRVAGAAPGLAVDPVPQVIGDDPPVAGLPWAFCPGDVPQRGGVGHARAVAEFAGGILAGGVPPVAGVGAHDVSLSRQAPHPCRGHARHGSVKSPVPAA
jgi:hypothetical protein